MRTPNRLARGVTAALATAISTTVTAAALLVGGTSASAAPEREPLRTGQGGTTGTTTGTSKFPPSLLAGIANAPATHLDGRCVGFWEHSVSHVRYRRSPDGRLDWNHYLTNYTKGRLTPTVTVSMPFAFLNGLPINPPYQPHTRDVNYDFHGSVNNVQYIGGGTDFITTGDVLTMYWFMQSVNGNSADRYIACEIPPPGTE